MKFEGKKAVVVGGGSGMGRSISLECAKEGADIAVLDVKNADETANEVKALGRQAIAMQVDVTNFKAMNNCINSVYDEFKRIDILANCAGYAQLIPFVDMTEEMWDRNMAVHLKGVFNATRAVINGMVSQGYGRIISISSVAGVRGTPRHCHYSAAKAGVIGLTKALAQEVAPFGVTVNAIAPWTTDTAFSTAESKEKQRQQSPVGRITKPEDIAALCVFLASDEAATVTGAVININCGIHM